MFRAVSALFSSYENVWEGIEPIKHTLIDFQTRLLLIAMESFKEETGGSQQTGGITAWLAKSYALADRLIAYTEKNRRLQTEEYLEGSLLPLCQLLTKDSSCPPLSSASLCTDVLIELPADMQCCDPVNARVEELFGGAERVLHVLDWEVEVFVRDEAFVAAYRQARSVVS